MASAALLKERRLAIADRLHRDSGTPLFLYYAALIELRFFLLRSLDFDGDYQSPLLESHTGAWWDPWWLLVIKTVCVIVFLYCLQRNGKH